MATELTDTTFFNAAMYDDLNKMRKLREAGWPFGSASFAMAARLGGKAALEKMRCLKAEGCPWDADTFTDAVGAASKDGDLENLQWLAANNCPWNTKTFAEAIEGGNIQVIEWLANPTWRSRSEPLLSSGKDEILIDKEGEERHTSPCPIDDNMMFKLLTKCHSLMSIMKAYHDGNKRWLDRAVEGFKRRLEVKDVHEVQGDSSDDE